MSRKADLILLAFCAVSRSAAAALVRIPAVGEDPRQQLQEDVVLEAKDATLLDFGAIQAKKVPKVAVVQTLKGNVEASDRIEDGGPRRRRLGQPLLCAGPRRENGLQAPRALHLRRAQPGSRPRHRGVREQATPSHARASSSSGPSTRRNGATVAGRADPHLGPHPLQGHSDLPRRQGVCLEQTIPWTKVKFPKVMPVQGITPGVGRQTGTTRWYTTVRRFWVEPVTGAPVYGEEIREEELRGSTLLGDRDKVTAFAGHVKMREDYIKHTVALVKSNRTLILLLTSGVSAGGLPAPGRGSAVPLPLPRGAQPPPGRPGPHGGGGTGAGQRLSRAFVCRVGSAVAGSSGRGCLG